jgi:hypothetical protein
LDAFLLEMQQKAQYASQQQQQYMPQAPVYPQQQPYAAGSGATPAQDEHMEIDPY